MDHARKTNLFAVLMAEFVTLIDQWYVVQLQGLRKLYPPIVLVAQPYDCDPSSQATLSYGLSPDFGMTSISTQ